MRQIKTIFIPFCYTCHMIILSLIIILNSIGAAISLYILRQKTTKQKLVCIIGKDCNEVVTSKYASFFGIPNELMGLGYYVFFVTISLLIQTHITTLFSIPLSEVRMLAAFGSLLFSLYLTYLQLFVLKKFCEYCLAINIVNLLLFLLLFLS